MPAPLTIAFLSSNLDFSYLLPAFQAQFPEARLRLGTDLGPLDAIDAAVCWYPPEGLLARLPRLRLIQSVGAGIDHITADPALPDLPVCRIIDPDMGQGMTAYVTWAVIQHQRHMGAYLRSAAARRWEEQPVQPPRQHRVGIAGLGTLGLACAEALLNIGYSVRGWSRSPKRDLPAGLQAFHGDAGQAEFLAGCDTLVCLLPLTEDTRGILGQKLFSQLPQGAHLINVGRGAHLVEADLLAALASGQLAEACLDVTDPEPLPAEHPFWRHPRIRLTPHIASMTQPLSAAEVVLDNLQRHATGAPLLGLVDRQRGY